MISDQLFVHDYRPNALLKVSGEDAFSFLQGQFSNELRQIKGSAVYGLWLNQKGRVVADSHVLSLGEKEYYVISVGSSAAVIRPRLEAYIIADDVAVSDEPQTACGVALFGAGCGEIIRQAFGAIPEAGRFVHSGGLLAFPGRRLQTENYEIIGPAEILGAWRQNFFAQGGVGADTERMELARILAEVPAIPPDLGPADLPNEGGLETVAISYTKGCYLGQEVMARLKNLGQVRRRLHCITGAGAPPLPATALYQGQRKAGEIRSAVRNGDGFVALAMLSLVSLDPAAGLSRSTDGPPTIMIHAHG